MSLPYYQHSCPCTPTECLKHSKKASKRVPKGTSAYQAAWIVDEGEEESSGEDEEEEDEDHLMEEAFSQVTGLAMFKQT